MCLSQVTSDSLEKRDALSAELLISLIFIFSRHQLGEMAHYRFSSRTWCKVDGPVCIQSTRRCNSTGAQTVETHHMVFSSFSLPCLDCKGGDTYFSAMSEGGSGCSI